jgi:hypothetical protein
MLLLQLSVTASATVHACQTCNKLRQLLPVIYLSVSVCCYMFSVH